MEIWKTLRVSHIPIPPAATKDKCLTRRYTNIPLGTKDRSGPPQKRDPVRLKFLGRLQGTSAMNAATLGRIMKHPQGGSEPEVYGTEGSLMRLVTFPCRCCVPSGMSVIFASTYEPCSVSVGGIRISGLPFSL